MSRRFEGRQRVGGSGRGQERGRAEPDVAGDRLGQVDAEEREGRVRDRVDQGPHEVAGVGLELQVAASERDDSWVLGLAGGLGEAVGPEAGAGDGSAVGIGPWLVSTIVVEPLRERRRTATPVWISAPSALDLGRHHAGDGGEVDDAGLRGVEGGDSDGVGLDLGDLGARRGGGGPGRRSRRLGARVRRARGARSSSRAMMSLPQRSYADSVLVAVLVQGVAAGGAELGLEGSGRVVDARVDDAGVVAGLVGGDLGLALEHEDAGVRVAAAAVRGRWPGRGCRRRRRSMSQGRSVNGSRVRGRRRRRGGSRSRSPRGPGSRGAAKRRS